MSVILPTSRPRGRSTIEIRVVDFLSRVHWRGAQTRRPCWCKPDIQCPLWIKSGHVRRTSRCPLNANSGHPLPATRCVNSRTDAVRVKTYPSASSAAGVSGVGAIEVARAPPAMGCHAPISINPGFTGNRTSNMRQVRRANVAHSNRAGPVRRSALLSAKPAKTRRSKSSNFDRSLVGYAIRPPSAELCPTSNIRNICPRASPLR